MPIRVIQCHAAECDECDRGFGYEEDTTNHYDSRAALDRALSHSDWTVTGERLLCEECQERAACNLVGHRWEEWGPFDVPERPGWPEYHGRQRSCEHCGCVEYDPPIRTGGAGAAPDAR